MNALFDHFVLTRFAEDVFKQSRKIKVEEWLNNRIKLFEKFCLPSIMNQTNKNFKWLLFIDKNLSKRCK